MIQLTDPNILITHAATLAAMEIQYDPNMQSWVIIDPAGYLYINKTLAGVVKEMVLEFRHDRHLAG